VGKASSHHESYLAAGVTARRSEQKDIFKSNRVRAIFFLSGSGRAIEQSSRFLVAEMIEEKIFRWQREKLNAELELSGVEAS
jgi:hypothetical protein